MKDLTIIAELTKKYGKQYEVIITELFELMWLTNEREGLGMERHHFLFYIGKQMNALINSLLPWEALQKLEKNNTEEDDINIG